MQTSSLHHEEQYFLDSALEYGEISAVAWNAIVLWGDRVRVEAMINETSRRKASGASGWRALRQDICLSLEDYALELTLGQSVSIQRSMSACAILYARKWITDAAEVVADWHRTDATVGGALQPFRRARRVTRHGTPSKGAMREIVGERSIRNYVKRLDDCLPHMVEIAQRLRRLPWPQTLSENAIVIDMLQAQSQEIRAKQERAIREARARVFGEEAPKPYRIVKRETRKMRRRIVRSAAIAAAILGAPAVSAFARGEPVEICGEQATLELRAKRQIASIGHGACDITIKSKDGAALGKLCCYFDQTPALDQLAAFALHMRAGEEQTILQTGNLHSITETGMNHPLLLGRKQATTLPEPARGFRFDQMLRQAHFAAVGAKYEDAILTRVFGRDASRLRRFWARAPVDESAPTAMERAEKGEGDQ